MQNARRRALPDDRIIFDESSLELRWFLLSSEAKSLLLDSKKSVAQNPVFTPKSYEVKLDRTLWNRILKNYCSGRDEGNYSWTWTEFEALRCTEKEAENSNEIAEKDLESAVSCAVNEARQEVQHSPSSVPAQTSARQNWDERKIVLAEKITDASKLLHKWHHPPASIFGPTSKVWKGHC